MPLEKTASVIVSADLNLEEHRDSDKESVVGRMPVSGKPKSAETMTEAEKTDITNIIQNSGLASSEFSLDIKPLENSANETFVVAIKDHEQPRKIFLKVYNATEGRAVKNCELWIRDFLPTAIATPTVLAIGCYEERDYLITEFIEGVTLLEKINGDSVDITVLTALSEQLMTFIRNCTDVAIEGFGSLDSRSKRGQHSVFADFIRKNIENAYRLFESANLQHHDKDSKELIDYINFYRHILDNYLEEHQDYFNHVTARLIPLDLNLNNFIVSQENKIFMTDLESFAGADPLLAFGELYGHVYLSPFGEFFSEEYEKLAFDEQKIIHFYALLGCFNVFCFCIAHHVPNLKALTPWGNPNTFIDLMHAHEEKINAIQCTFAMGRK